MEPKVRDPRNKQIRQRQEVRSGSLKDENNTTALRPEIGAGLPPLHHRRSPDTKISSPEERSTVSLLPVSGSDSRTSPRRRSRSAWKCVKTERQPVLLHHGGRVRATRRCPSSYRTPTSDVEEERWLSAPTGGKGGAKESRRPKFASKCLRTTAPATDLHQPNAGKPRDRRTPK